MSNICFGIISYLPDNKEVRKLRYQNLLNLLLTCYRFQFPIIIIAQNWNIQEIANLNKKVELKQYQKLGIVGARKELRKQFLKSQYDYLVMLDDDCVITATDSGIAQYISEIQDHPNCAGEFRNTLLKLYAISKTIFKEIDFDDNFNAEDGIGFEDTIFVNRVRKQFPNNIFTFKVSRGLISESSLNANDKLSTWYTNQNLNKMLDTTHKLVAEIMNKK